MVNKLGHSTFSNTYGVKRTSRIRQQLLISSSTSPISTTRKTVAEDIAELRECGLDIVVALVENETTLKRLYIDAECECIRLHPENKKMKDILVKSCYIQGVAQHVIKAL